VNPFAYDWLVSALRERDGMIEAHLVTTSHLRLLVLARGERFVALPLEGSFETTIDFLGGVRSRGFFALGAEADEVRREFVERALAAVQSPAAPRRQNEHGFLENFRRLGLS
jgi:hypothetical protein